MLNRIRMILSDKGASAVEYGLLVAGIAAVVMAAVFLLGGAVNDTFTSVDNKISPAAEVGDDD